MPEEAATPVTHSFEADVSQVLHLVIHSLYSHKEIFLRELVSNASDALDKLRFRALTEPDLYEGDMTLAIRIHADPEHGTLTIEDNGVGMTEEELVRDLGTVARSGSRAFLEKLAQKGQSDARLIGQFGVGFYSAYLVADRVEVVSRAAGPGQAAHRWVSEAKNTFTVGPAERATRGTAITLHLRKGTANEANEPNESDFLEEWRLRDLITRYSDYVSHPIQLLVTKGTGAEAKTEYETVNRASALWRRPKAEITDEQYAEFYRHLSHAAEDEGPIARTHFKVEGTQEFAGLLYVPRDKPFELRFGMKPRGVRLYVKRVLVMDDCEDIVPEWARFVVGVVDSDDLPLNVSREILQQSSAVRTIKKQVAKHVLDALETLAGERADDYAVAWRAFGPVLKQGVASDFEYRDRLAKLLRYESTAGEGLVSLADYVKRMKDGQDAVYYAIGESRKALEGAPHLEGLRKRGYEVLLMTDPIDEWATEALRTFEGKKLVSAMRSDLKIEATDDEKKARKADGEALGPLFDRIRTVLGARVTEVRPSDRLTDSPCCLVLAGTGPHGYVERLLREAGRDVPRTSRILELNPDHPIVQSLKVLVDRGDDPGSSGSARIAEWIEVLYDQALVAEGAPIEDPGGFARRITSLLAAVSKASAAAP
jgi:molecular chaperone HtpG